MVGVKGTAIATSLASVEPSLIGTIRRSTELGSQASIRQRQALAGNVYHHPFQALPCWSMDSPNPRGYLWVHCPLVDAATYQPSWNR